MVNIGDADDDAGKAPVIVARVVNVSAAPEGKWDVDCAYLKELNEDDLLAVGRNCHRDRIRCRSCCDLHAHFRLCGRRT